MLFPPDAADGLEQLVAGAVDDIGFGQVSSGVDFSDRFTFNAILVYYSIYDSTGTTELATNAFGLYILNNAIETSDSERIYYFP